MKTNKQKNQEHDTAAQKIRPKQPVYDFTGIEAVVKQWVKAHE